MRLIISFIFLLLGGLEACAKNAANLIADRIQIAPDGVLLASGSVTVWQGDTQITADEITYSSKQNKLNIVGPIHLTDGSGTVILANQAILSRDLTQGIIYSARIILSQKVQIATAQISRINSRYAQAYNVAATSCFICNNEVPLWQIRAKRIVHDSLEKQLYFDQAHLRVRDIPVFFFPYLRLPDPSLKRATGFLVPQLSTSTTLGTAIRTPYFLKIGANRDLTLTPVVSTKTDTLNYRYRQAFQNGSLHVDGALSHDTLLPKKGRGYLLGNAGFNLDSGYFLGVQLQAVSDPSYMFEYDISEIDRLESNITLNRTARFKNSELRFSNYYSLRNSENNATQPTLVTESFFQRRLYPEITGGVIDLETSFLVSYRYSDQNIDGYDTARLSFNTDWHRDWTYYNGIIVDVETEFETSQYHIRQNTSVSPNVTRFSAAQAIGLRWPLSRRLKNGGTQRIEPRIQLAGLKSFSGNIPNQDSTRVEFDEGNLYRINRVPGFDRTEPGTRLNLGVSSANNYANSTTIGWEIGRVYRNKNIDIFSKSSGLSGSISDWLVVGSFGTATGIELIARALLKDSGDVKKTEARFTWQNSNHKISASHVGLGVDFEEGRITSLSSLALNWQYDFTNNWQSRSEFQMDTTLGRLSKLNIGLRYINECVNLDFLASRRFSTSATLNDKTEFSFSIELLGFSSGVRKAPKKRQCGAL